MLGTHPLETIEESVRPNLFGQLSFFARSQGLKLLRGFRDLSSKVGPLPQSQDPFPHLLSESRSALHSAVSEQEKILERGKIVNLKVAIQKIDGAFGYAFSFWKQVGPPWKTFGFTVGRELRSGCLVPAVGGGICQLSGCLFEAAKLAGLGILERHTHTRRLPGIPYRESRDATVFWNYLDLRFWSKIEFQIRTTLTETELVVQIRGKSPAASVTDTIDPLLSRSNSSQNPASDCLSCGKESCVEHRSTKRHTRSLPSLALLDRYQPEFSTFLASHWRHGGEIFIPIDGAFWKLPGFHWPLIQNARRRTFPLSALWRMAASRIASRKIVPAKRRLEQARLLAHRYLQAAPKRFGAIFVDQSLVPFLELAGFLKDLDLVIFAARLPMRAFHERLMEAVAIHPSSSTLREYRAPEEIVEAEIRAFSRARKIVTAHPDVASHWEKAELVPWESRSFPVTANSLPRGEPDLFLFPGPTAIREGAYEVREAAKVLGVPLCVLGRNIESDDFWKNTTIEKCNGNIPWVRIRAVLHPGLFISDPRVHLHAVQQGIPVIASPGIGLRGKLTSLVPFGKSDQLIQHIKAIS